MFAILIFRIEARNNKLSRQNILVKVVYDDFLVYTLVHQKPKTPHSSMNNYIVASYRDVIVVTKMANIKYKIVYTLSGIFVLVNTRDSVV